MIKIKVSYETQEELRQLLQKLHPSVNKCKIPRQQSGKFKKAYIEIKNPDRRLGGGAR